MKIQTATKISIAFGVAVLVAEFYLRKARRGLRAEVKNLQSGVEEKAKELERINTTLHEEIQDRKGIEEDLLKKNQELRDLSARIQTVREEERTRIAREIHDVLGQQLTVLKMDISWLKKRLAGSGKNYEEKLSQMISTINDTIQCVKKISTELHPAILDDLGLIPAIEWQCGEFDKRTGIHCEFLSEINDIQLPDTVATAIFRIIQESLTNVMRHAHATEVRVNASKSGDNFLITVKDNGKGISDNNKKGKSLGLLSMRERAHLFNGDVVVMGEAGIGTTVRIEIPLNEMEMQVKT